MDCVKLPLDEVVTPARLAKSLYRDDNTTIFARGTLLYRKQVFSLKKYGITHIFVEVGDSADEKPFFQAVDEMIRELKSSFKKGATLPLDSSVADLANMVSDKSKESILLQRKGSVQGTLIPLEHVETGNILASSFYREKIEVLSAGTPIIQQYIDYLKKNGVSDVWIEHKPRAIVQELAIKEITFEEKSREMGSYNGDPGKMMQILSWIEEAVSGDQHQLVDAIGHLAQTAEVPLNIEALSALGRMAHPKAFESLLNILVSGDPELFEPVLDVMRDTRDQKTLISRILENLPAVDKELRDQLLQFMTDFPEDILQQVSTSMASTCEQDVQLYCFAILNRIASKRRLYELNMPDKTRNTINNKLDTEVKNAESRGTLGRMESKTIGTVKELSAKILQYDPLTGSDREVIEAIQALGSTRDSRAMASLQYALDFFDVGMKQEALRAIMQVYAPNQVRIVVSALRFDDSVIEAMVRGFFAQKNDAYTISFLVRHLKDEGGVMRKRMLKLIASLPRERVIGVVEKLKQRGAEDVRELAQTVKNALGRNGS